MARTRTSRSHIWLGNHLIASITGSGDEGCFIVTAAFGSPLAAELPVFKAFRDKVLERFSAGNRFINWYYKGGGPDAAKWLQSHDTARLGTRMLLSALAIPLRAFLFGKIVVLLSIFLCALCAFAVSKKLGLRWASSSLLGFSVALALVIGYSYLMDVPVASASYTQSGIYYYTSDHIGRPFALRDQSQELTWYERHLAFGEQIDEWSASMPAGLYERQISWKPNFRFPGQYQDPDMGLSATSTPLFVQNHYREYMPGVGRYSRADSLYPYNYKYSLNNPLIIIDIFGLKCSSAAIDAILSQYDISYSLWYSRNILSNKQYGDDLRHGRFSEDYDTYTSAPWPINCGVYADELVNFFNVMVPNACCKARRADRGSGIIGNMFNHSWVRVWCKYDEDNCNNDKFIVKLKREYDPYWKTTFPIFDFINNF